MQDKAVRRDWFSETQLRDGHKKDEREPAEKKGMKSLGESQTKHPFALPKLFFSRIYLFSGVLECHTEGGESQKPWSAFPTKGGGEGEGMQGKKYMIRILLVQAESKVMVAIKEVNENELSENGGSPSASPGPHVGSCSFNSPLLLLLCRRELSRE